MPQLALNINLRDKVLEYIDTENNRKIPLGGSSSNQDITNIMNLATSNLKFNKSKFRDHYDIENGSMNYLSPFYKYLGWHLPIMRYTTKEDDNANIKPFFTPTFYRLAGDENYNIDSVTLNHLSLVNAESKRKQNLFTEGLLIKDEFINNPLVYTDKFTNKQITIPARHADAFHQMKFFRTSFHNYIQNGNELSFYYSGQKTEILMMQIDWRTVPENSYFRISVPYQRGTINYRLLMFNRNTSITTVKTGPLFGEYLGEIKNLTLDTTDNAYKFEGMQGETIKLVPPTSGERFTYIVLEAKITSQERINSISGLGFNLYVPEEIYRDCTRALDQNIHIFIPDIKKVGKLYNAMGSLSDYQYAPTFAKNGDIVLLVENLSHLDGDKITFRPFICMHGYAEYDAHVVSPSTHHQAHHLFNGLPGPTITDKLSLEFFFNMNGKKHSHFTFFKEVLPFHRPSEVDVNATYTVNYVDNRQDATPLENFSKDFTFTEMMTGEPLYYLLEKVDPTNSVDKRVLISNSKFGEIPYPYVSINEFQNKQGEFLGNTPKPTIPFNYFEFDKTTTLKYTSGLKRDI